MEGIIKKKLSFMTLTIETARVGEDYSVLIYGGGKPHIGCTVLAVPRLSLDGSGRMSATASVINIAGHKDETVCRYIAEHMAAGKNAAVVCSGGIHVDGITPGQIDELMDAVKEVIL